MATHSAGLVGIRLGGMYWTVLLLIACLGELTATSAHAVPLSVYGSLPSVEGRRSLGGRFAGRLHSH
jgi:hypothetical protein